MALDKEIRAIQNNPAYLQGPGDPHPGRPDPAMYAEVLQLREQADGVADQLDDCLIKTCGGNPWVQLSVALQIQQQLNWCWAAVTSMISNFYEPANGFSQGQVATPTINQWRIAVPNTPTADCCNPAVAGTDVCNVTWGLLPPLYLTGHFGSITGGTISFPEVQNELISGHPVCVQIAWPGGGGHFAIIDGAQETGELIHVEDPATGSGVHPYATVVNSYQGIGTWVNTFLTTP